MEEYNSKPINSFSDIPLVFGPTDLARILGISRNMAYILANSSDFPTARVGKRILISKVQFLEWYKNKFGILEIDDDMNNI